MTTRNVTHDQVETLRREFARTTGRTSTRFNAAAFCRWLFDRTLDRGQVALMIQRAEMIATPIEHAGTPDPRPVAEDVI